MLDAEIDMIMLKRTRQCVVRTHMLVSYSKLGAGD